MSPIRRLVFTAPFVAILAGPLASAQTYPIRPISIIVSYPAGSDTDAMARLFAEKLSLRVKQPVFVQNRPGAGGTVGNSYVSRALPDGYTLLFTPNTLTTAPLVMKLPPASTYDALNGFTPVTQAATSPVLLVANVDTGFKTLADVIDAARKGKELSYGSPGAGSPMHIAGEWLNKAANIKIQHVPYRGVAPSVADVAAGHIPLAYVTLGPVAQYLKTGKLVALAVSDPVRSAFLPNIPTIAELGYKDVAAGAWYGFFSPKGTPDAIVSMLNANINEILKAPDVVTALHTIAADPVGGPPERLGKLNSSDYDRLGKIIAELGIQAE